MEAEEKAGCDLKKVWFQSRKENQPQVTGDPKRRRVLASHYSILMMAQEEDSKGSLYKIIQYFAQSAKASSVLDKYGI